MNRNIQFKVFKVNDWVLIYNSRLGPHPQKWKLRYIGPFQIIQDLGEGTFRMKDISGNEVEKPTNGFKLKEFHGVPPIPPIRASNKPMVGINFLMPQRK